MINIYIYIYHIFKAFLPSHLFMVSHIVFWLEFCTLDDKKDEIHCHYIFLNGNRIKLKRHEQG
jgi:hypothetical protein